VTPLIHLRLRLVRRYTVFSPSAIACPARAPVRASYCRQTTIIVHGAARTNDHAPTIGPRPPPPPS